MTDLVPHEDQTPALDRGRHGAPDLQHLLDLHQGAIAASAGIRAGPGWPVFRVEDAFNRTDAIQRVDAHAGWLAEQAEAVPPANTLRRSRDLVVQAATSPPDRRVVVAAVALFVSSRAKQPDNAPVYIRALEFDLIDLKFSPVVVVAALQRLRRESRFMPEVFEVIAACEAERNRLLAIVDRINSAGRYRVALEAATAGVPALRARAEAFSNPGADAWDKAVLGEGRS